MPSYSIGKYFAPPRDPRRAIVKETQSSEYPAQEMVLFQTEYALGKLSA